MRPGETATNKKRVYFPLFDIDGLPASGEVNEGAVWTPLAGELQYDRDEAGYTNATLANFTHVGDGYYRYIFSNAEISGTVEGSINLRSKDLAAIRTQVVTVPLRYDVDDALGLLHHNAVIDNFTFAGNLMTAARLRIFANAAAAAAATEGVADDADGEIMRFLITAQDGGGGKPDRFQMIRAL